MKRKRKVNITRRLLKSLGIEMLDNIKRNRIIKIQPSVDDLWASLGKLIVTKSGKRYGEAGTLISRPILRTCLTVKNPTPFCEGLELEKDEFGRFLIPYNLINDTGNYLVVDEVDLV